ncbi:uncharacterized protein METZ01_LOCUS357960 [marine metagenome]|uniref:Uncharacterized protein n=1 Tax=marine metagenome TaxID=408172 RepID=A0A382S5C3_9ZZZZ
MSHLCLAAIPKLAVFLMVFFVTILIVGGVVIIRVVHWEEQRRRSLEREEWEARKGKAQAAGENEQHGPESGQNQ